MHGDACRSLPSLKQTITGPDDGRRYGDRARMERTAVMSSSARMGTAWASPASLRDEPGVMPVPQTARLPRTTHAVGLRSSGLGSVSPPRQPPQVAATSRASPAAASAAENEVRAMDLGTPPRCDADAAVAGSAPASGKANQAKLESIREYLFTQGARHMPEKERNAAFRTALTEVTQLFPQLGSIMMPVSNYLRDVTTLSDLAEKQHAETLASREQAVSAKVESFFEEKTRALLREKKKLEASVATLQQEVLQLRTERDADLSTVKHEVMRRLNDSEQKEDEFRSFRQLIAAVYKTNEQLTNRIESLEQMLKKHRLEVPAAPPELYAFRSGGVGGETAPPSTDLAVRPLKEQVSPAFIAASQAELESARLNLQRELLTNAFDDHTAYRLQISSLKMDNLDLKAKVTTLEERVLDLNRYIYEKRFLNSYDEDGEHAPLTPRPCDIPFGIQTDLGVDLKHSTAEIVSELSAVGTNLKHQLNSSLLRLRQMATVTDWMHENTLTELDVADNGASVLPTFPLSAWPVVPHFLRTTVSPEVSNLRWTEAETGAIFLQFFRSLPALRAACRTMRDDKMVEPRRYQLSERREHVMTRLDATRDELLQKDGANVPFGYIVSQFIWEYLMTLNPASREATVVLPGTLQPRYTVRGEQKPVELEFTRFAYNMWWAAQRYRDTQPLCRYFLSILDGRLPPTLFSVTEDLLEKIKDLVQALDVDGSHVLTFHKLATGTSHVVADMGAQAGRCGVLAVAQTFEANEVPILAGRIRMDALIADETCVVLETRLGDELAAAATARQQRGLPPRITVCRVPGRTQQPPGASVYTRFWRRLVLQRYEELYLYVERLLGPLVVESDVVVGVYFLPLPETMALLQQLDDEFSLAPELAFRSKSFPNFPEDQPLIERDGVAEVFQEAVSGLPEITKNYLSLLRERGEIVARRAAYRVTTLRDLVDEALHSLPRLSRSVHFPFKHANEAARARVLTGADSSSPVSSPRRAPSTAKDRQAVPSGELSAPQSTAPAQSPAVPTGSKATTNKKKTGGKLAGKAKGVPAKPTRSSASTTAASAEATTSGRRRPRTPDAVPEALLIDDDREIVEWYGFCSALRQCVPPLNDRLLKMNMPSPDWSGLLEGLRGQLQRGSESRDADEVSAVSDENVDTNTQAKAR